MAVTLTDAQIANHIDEAGRKNASLHRVLSHKAGTITLPDPELLGHVIQAARDGIRSVELRRVLEDAVSLTSLSGKDYRTNLPFAGRTPELHRLFCHWRSP